MRKPLLRFARLASISIVCFAVRFSSQKSIDGKKNFDLYKFHELDEIEDHLKDLASERPEWVGLATLGVTHEGRKIYVATLVKPGAKVPESLDRS